MLETGFEIFNLLQLAKMHLIKCKSWQHKISRGMCMQYTMQNNANDPENKHNALFSFPTAVFHIKHSSPGCNTGMNEA